MNNAAHETLRQAVASIPSASWSDESGEWIDSHEILGSWTEEQLNQPVVVGEDDNGMTAILALNPDGREGRVLLTMVPPGGADLPPTPSVVPGS